MATSTTSASSVCASPPLAGSIVALTPAPLVSTPVTLLPSRNLKPCFSSMRWNCLATSPSMPGRMRSRNSTTVTSAPSRRQTEPSSRPMTPAPTTISFFGAGERQRAGRGNNLLLVDLDAGQARDVGAGRDHDRLRLVRRLAAVALDDHLAGRDDAAFAVQPVDLVLLEQERDAVDVGGDRVVLVFHQRGEIEFGRRRP